MNESTRKWPTLYKKSTQDKIEQWEISTFQNSGAHLVISSKWWDIQTQYGEIGGKVQTTTDTIKKGKNVGKTNETNTRQQAEAEAQSKYEKKLKTGYVTSLEAALAGERDKIIEGGIDPMLAHSYDDHHKKIKFPCHWQPKLDGIRCIAVKLGKDVTLWSRTRKPIKSCTHIEEAIRDLPVEDTILDGELYSHKYRDDFEKIVSAVRKDEPSPESLSVEYHIYDTPIEDMSFEDRQGLFQAMRDAFTQKLYLTLVNTGTIGSPNEVNFFHDEAVGLGYEGIMLRNSDSLYEHKRSYGLQKVKIMKDAEFEIVGAEEGRGKLQGHLGAFVCKTEDGTQFKVKMAGPQEQSKEYWENREEYIGRDVTVQFQSLTGANKVPRFPVGLRVRELGL